MDSNPRPKNRNLCEIGLQNILFVCFIYHFFNFITIRKIIEKSEFWLRIRNQNISLKLWTFLDNKFVQCSTQCQLSLLVQFPCTWKLILEPLRPALKLSFCIGMVCCCIHLSLESTLHNLLSAVVKFALTICFKHMLMLLSLLRYFVYSY